MGTRGRAPSVPDAISSSHAPVVDKAAATLAGFWITQQAQDPSEPALLARILAGMQYFGEATEKPIAPGRMVNIDTDLPEVELASGVRSRPLVGGEPAGQLRPLPAELGGAHARAPGGAGLHRPGGGAGDDAGRRGAPDEGGRRGAYSGLGGAHRALAFVPGVSDRRLQPTP